MSLTSFWILGWVKDFNGMKSYMNDEQDEDAKRGEEEKDIHDAPFR